MKVLKESGKIEGFKRKKILNSLINSGVSTKEADDIIERVLMTLSPPLSTRKIFRASRKFLRARDNTATMRYSLKKAIYALGPTGYPFEKYVARILQARGYSVEVGEIVDGRCVSHEVDVVALKGNTRYMVECKFHKNGKTYSNVKTALYVHARLLDIIKAHRSTAPHDNRVHKGMLVTNTRFTSEAIKYAECCGLKAVGWKHPDGESLEQMIDHGRTYPVTVLPTLKRADLEALIQSDIVIVRDVEEKSAKEIVNLTGIDLKLVERLKAHSGRLCG
jgi:Holliday junction resolvase-like predicted endonuclease